MGFFSNFRANVPPSSPTYFKRKVWSLVPICVALFIIIEIGFLGRLDNTALVNTLTDLFIKSPSSSHSTIKRSDLKVGSGLKRCEEWLERDDSVTYSKDFIKDPIFISGGDMGFESCSVDCASGISSDKKPDAAFGLSHQLGTLSIICSMESAKYYLAQARRVCYDIVMTTTLSSDVPVGKALASAFISNCGALEALMETNVKIDAYGNCVKMVKESISLSQEQPQEDVVFGFKPKTLFVFGDSYADTGNTPVLTSPSWRFPYGITFPGKPTGRFNDGRVSTDYLAKYLGLGRTPIAYKWRRRARPRQVMEKGMNFAVGGAGVFETVFNVPNVSVQIDFFEQLLSNKVYSPADLNSSVAFLSIVGNDYITYSILNGTQKGRPAFIRRVVKQMLSDVKRIKDLGVRKVLVSLSPPQLCFPLVITSKDCNTNDTFTFLHNTLLREGLTKLNDENTNNNDKSFLIFDLYNAFVTIFKNRGVPGISRFSEPLKPCCVGTKAGKACGDVGKNGENLFNLCKDPNSFFFWDSVHITDQGWRSVFYLLLHHPLF